MFALLESSYTIDTIHVCISDFKSQVITQHPVDADVPLGGNITLTCKASGEGTLIYSWEWKSSTKNPWSVVKNNSTSYTTNALLSIGEYMYRCRVDNKVGIAAVSNIATITVYGKYCLDS